MLFIYSAFAVLFKSSASLLSGFSSVFSVLIWIFLYTFNPVPAGINFPIITFSFSPINSSTLPFTAASVNTLVVSWNEAADKKLSVARDAFVIPSNTLLYVAGLFPSATTFSFSSSTS